MYKSKSYPVWGAKDVSNANFNPSAIWSSMVISVSSTLSVDHFSENDNPGIKSEI